MVDRRRFKSTSLFAVYKELIETELTQLEDYIHEISIDLKGKQESLEEKYKEASSEVEDDFDVFSYFEDDIHRYFNVFPVYTYNPLLLSLYGQFENWLKKICDLDSRKDFSKVKVSDLVGNNYIEKSRRYLEIVAEINLSEIDNEWQQIVRVQKIRNCIAHNNSNILKNRKQPIEKQELYSSLLNDPNIEFDKVSGDFYIKDKQFLLDIIAVCRKYLSVIVEKLKGRTVVAKNLEMPYDNTGWGREKTESLILDIIHALDMLDDNEKRSDEFKDSDLKANLRSNFSSMSWNLTKILAFFYNGEWSTIDGKMIVEQRKEGLSELKKIYSSKML